MKYLCEGQHGALHMTVSTEDTMVLIKEVIIGSLPRFLVLPRCPFHQFSLIIDSIMIPSLLKGEPLCWRISGRLAFFLGRRDRSYCCCRCFFLLRFFYFKEVGFHEVALSQARIICWVINVQLGFYLINIAEANITYIPWDSSLVLHGDNLLTISIMRWTMGQCHHLPAHSPSLGLDSNPCMCMCIVTLIPPS